MAQLSSGAVAGIAVAVVVIVVLAVVLGLYYGIRANRHKNNSSQKVQSNRHHHREHAPGPAGPGLLRRLGSQAGTALASTDFVVNAKQALAMIDDKAQKSTLIVAMEGCGACKRLRAALDQMKQSGQLKTDEESVGVLLTSEWAQLKDKLPAHAMPQMYKVGGGDAPVKGPTGFRDAQGLLDFIKTK